MIEFIKDAKVVSQKPRGFDWNTLEVIAVPPTLEEFTFEEKRDGLNMLYFGTHPDGWVNFFSHSPIHENGFGGSTFTLKMKDDSIRRIKGPWSSRNGVMLAAGFPPAVDCIIRPEGWGHSGRVCNLLVEKAKLVVEKFCPEYEIAIETKTDEESYGPVMNSVFSRWDK